MRPTQLKYSRIFSIYCVLKVKVSNFVAALTMLKRNHARVSQKYVWIVQYCEIRLAAYFVYFQAIFFVGLSANDLVNNG